jgi:hypothetical protein
MRLCVRRLTIVSSGCTPGSSDRGRVRTSLDLECPAVDGEFQTCLTRYDAHIRSCRMVRSSAIVRASSDGLARARSMRCPPEICGAVSQRIDNSPEPRSCPRCPADCRGVAGADPSKSGYRFSSVAQPNSLSQHQRIALEGRSDWTQGTACWQLVSSRLAKVPGQRRIHQADDHLSRLRRDLHVGLCGSPRKGPKLRPPD